MNLTLSNRIFYGAFAGSIILHLILIWIVRLYPFQDLPWHLAAATIVKHLGEPGNQFADYFYVNTSVQPNIFHLVFTSWDIFPTVEIGNKWFLTLYIVLMPISTLLLIRHFKGNPWFSLLSFIYLYNYNVRWGFVGFIIAIPVFQFLLYFIFKLTSRNNLWDRVMVIVLFVLLFFIHALPTIFAMAVFMAAIVYRYRHSVGRILAESLLLIPVLGMMVLWWTGRKEKDDTVGFLIDYYSKEYFTFFYKRIGLFVADNYALFDGVAGFIVAALLSLGLLIFLFFWFRSGAGSLKQRLQQAVPVNAWIYLLVGLGIFFFGPNRLPEQQYLYQRFAVFVCLSLVIIISVLFARNFNRRYLTIICLTFLAHFILYTDYFMSFQKENHFFTKEIVPIYSANSKLAAILAEDTYRGHHQYQHYANYHIVWNKGIALTSLMDFRFGTVRRKASLQMLPKYNAWFADNKSYDGSYKNMDYILVKGVLPELVERRIAHFQKVKSSGPWSLYQNKKLLTSQND